MENTKLAFLDVKAFDNGQASRGAILITDAATDPQEFRCTSAIRPTLLQRTIWGKRLSGYLAAQLIGKPLIDAVSNGSAIVLVRCPDFVELRPLIQVPLVQLLRNEELAKAAQVTLPGGDDDILQSSIGLFEPIVMKVHRDHSADMEAAHRILDVVFRSFSLLEPFERIDHALDLVHQQDVARPGT